MAKISPKKVQGKSAKSPAKVAKKAKTSVKAPDKKPVVSSVPKPVKPVKDKLVADADRISLATLAKNRTKRGSYVTASRARDLWQSLVGPLARNMVGGGDPCDYNTKDKLINEFGSWVVNISG